MLLKASGGDVDTAADITWTGQHEFTKVPAGTSFGDAPLVINPASANANERLLDVGLNGSDRFYVDEDGRAVAEDGFASNEGLTSGDTQVVRMNNVLAFKSGHPNGFLFTHYSSQVAGRYRIGAGCGCDNELALKDSLDQDDVMLKRDVDGGSSYSEAGSLLHLWRDVTNVTSEDGNFLECSTDGSTVLAGISADGDLMTSAEINPVTAGGDLTMDCGTKGSAGAGGELALTGGDGYPDGDHGGGDVAITGGDGAGMGNGGWVVLTAGNAGASGDEGGIAIEKHDGTNMIECQDDRIAFFATTPQAQQAHIADADGTLADITTKFNTLLEDLEGYGLLASS